MIVRSGRRSIGLSVRRSIGRRVIVRSGRRSIGLSVRRSSGLSVRRSIGRRVIVRIVRRSIGLSVRRSAVPHAPPPRGPLAAAAPWRATTSRASRATVALGAPSCSVRPRPAPLRPTQRCRAARRPRGPATGMIPARPARVVTTLVRTPVPAVMTPVRLPPVRMPAVAMRLVRTRPAASRTGTHGHRTPVVAPTLGPPVASRATVRPSDRPLTVRRGAPRAPAERPVGGPAPPAKPGRPARPAPRDAPVPPRAPPVGSRRRRLASATEAGVADHLTVPYDDPTVEADSRP